jgi:tetratricopeptide (TPR) repeat protein
MNNEVRRRLQRGDYLLEIQRPSEAVREFEQALAAAPENAEVMCYMARAFAQLKDPDRALDYVSRAIAAKPDDEWAFRIKAHAHLLEDDRASAYKAATRAVQLAPESIECLWMLANCAMAVDRIEEARTLGELLRRQAPESIYGHRILGDVAERLENFAGAARQFEKVLELDAGNANALESLARVRGRFNKYGDSVSLLRGALAIDPNREDRQDSFKISMKRFALFGHAGARRNSVAGMLSTGFLLYLGLGFLASRVIGDRPWFGAVFLYGFVILPLAGIPLLRSRFLASQSAQLKLLYDSLSRQKRRRTLLATGIAIATAYGIAGLIYLDVGDAGVFIWPVAIVVTCCWIYMLAISFYLLVLWLSDTWTRLFKSDIPDDERGVSAGMIALPTVTGVALAIGLYNDHSAAWLVFFAASVATAIVYFRRYQLGTSLFFIVCGVALLLVDLQQQSSIDDLTLGELGLIIAGIGLCGAALRGFGEFRKYWQRRRISRLLGQQAP